MSGSGFPFAARLAFVRTVMGELGLDALVVTHPANLRFLCGFAGTTGALVVDAQGCSLVVDFRYLTIARELPERHPDLSSLAVVRAERSEDEALVKILEAAGMRRIGIEAAWMPVARFNGLSSALATATPLPLAPDRSCPVLVPTDRVVERARLVKDSAEIDVLRTAA